MAGSTPSSKDITVKQAASMPRGAARKIVLKEALARKRKSTGKVEKIDAGYAKFTKGGAYDKAQQELYRKMEEDKKKRMGPIRKRWEQGIADSGRIPKSPTQ